MNWLVFGCLLGWIYILTVLYRAKLNFWYYICGSVGLFIFSLILIEPYVVVPLQKAVSAASNRAINTPTTGPVEDPAIDTP